MEEAEPRHGRLAGHGMQLQISVVGNKTRGIKFNYCGRATEAEKAVELSLGIPVHQATVVDLLRIDYLTPNHELPHSSWPK